MANNQIVSIVDTDAASTAAVERVLRTMNLESAVYRSGMEFLDQLDPRQPGCVILEVRLPGINGLQVQEDLTARRALQPVIFLTGYATVSIAVRALRCGALHFLEKPVREDELWLAVTEALEVDEKRQEVLAKWRKIRELVTLLDDEERQLAGLVIAGKTNRQIADELQLCLRTVELRRARMMRKLGVKSVSQLAQLCWAMENGDHSCEKPDGQYWVPRHWRFDRLLVPEA